MTERGKKRRTEDERPVQYIDPPWTNKENNEWGKEEWEKGIRRERDQAWTTYMELVPKSVVHDEGRGQHAQEHEDEAIHKDFRGLRSLNCSLPDELRVHHD